jgi:hypothetical protein
VSVDEVLEWAGRAGFTGTVGTLERQWYASTAEELASITHRIWPALRELDEDMIDEVTRPAVDALRALPEERCLRRATAEIVELARPWSSG